MYAKFDTSNFPIVLISLTGEEANDQNFRTYLEGLDEIYARKEPFSIVFDATQSPSLSLRYQKMQAYWIKNNKELIESYCRGTAYVFKKATTRLILKLIFAINPQPVPYKIFVEVSDARRWAREILKA